MTSESKIRAQVFTKQHGDLAKRVPGENRLVAQRRARLVMNHRDAVGQSDLMGEDQGFPGIGGMGLIKQGQGHVGRPEERGDAALRREASES